MRPSDSSRAAMAPAQLAGFPMRIAVASVSGFGTGCPSTRGQLPLPESPSSEAAMCLAGFAVLFKSFPVGRDIAGVAYGDGQIIGSVPQGVHDFKGRGFLPFDPIRVDRVDQRDRVLVRQFTHELRASSKLPRIATTWAPCINAWLSLPRAMLPSGIRTMACIPARAA